MTPHTCGDLENFNKGFAHHKVLLTGTQNKKLKTEKGPHEFYLIKVDRLKH